MALDTGHIRRQLLARRERLLRGVARVEEDLRWLEASLEPELEEESQEENLARLLARLDDRGQAEIEAIDQALARIAIGDYGRCVECREAIPEARLEAVPTAATCVACAAATERARS